MTQVNKAKLTLKRQRLVELMQDINFGCIANITVRDGEPELTPETVIEREIKFLGQNGPRPERDCNDFSLKQEVIALLEKLTIMGNGTIRQLEIKHGLPFLMRMEERAA